MPVLSLQEIDLHREIAADAAKRKREQPEDLYWLDVQRTAERITDKAIAQRIACKPCPFCPGGALSSQPTQGVLICVDCGAVCLDTTRTPVVHGGVQPCPGQTDPCGMIHHCGRD